MLQRFRGQNAIELVFIDAQLNPHQLTIDIQSLSTESGVKQAGVVKILSDCNNKES